MKLKTRKATNSYETDEQLAAAIMSRMGKQVRETLNANSKMGTNYGMANTKERLADMIRSRRAMLEERGYDTSNRAVLDSLGKSEKFRSAEERGIENAMKGFTRSILAETVQAEVDAKGNVHYSGYTELPNGRYQDLATGKLVSKETLYEKVFKDIGFVPGKTQLNYDPVNKTYSYKGENGKDYEIIFGKDYSKRGGAIVKEI